MRQSRRWGLKVLYAVLVLFGCIGLYGLYLYSTLTLPRGEDRQPLRIYGAPYPLSEGMRIDKVRVQSRLDHLGYRRVSRKLQQPGEYRLIGSSWEVYVRDFLYPEGQFKSHAVRLVVENDRISHVLRLPDERTAGPVSLEPPLLGGLLATSRQVREWIPFAALPQRLVDAVLAIEDHRFHQHIGIDPLAILRAAWENLKGGSVRQGGSTITQQLAKNLYYSPHRTFLRKIRESLAALILEAKYSKGEILESYLNEIYLGQSGSVAVYGVGEAARYYFGKAVQDLTVSEAALLAGMIKGPNTYAPVRDSNRSKRRRDVVLLRLKQEGKLSERQYQAAISVPVRAATLQKGLTDAPYFLDYLLSHLEDSSYSGLQPGLRIFTTLDPEMQRIAEESVSIGLARLESHYPFLASRGDLQGALVALEPATGGIRALVGGRDYRIGQFNHASQAKRQAGSLFKPFVYIAAFERSLESTNERITPATLIEDAPISFPNGVTPWSPQNYDRKFHGQVTVRTALEESLNIPAVRVAHTVGVRHIIDIMRGLGLKGPLEDNLSFALGTSEVSLLEITGAYGALAQGGRFVPPTGLKAIAGEHPEDLVSKEVPDASQVFSPQSAYLMTSTLKGVMERGTAAQAKSSMGLTATVAGKTGTTDDHRDAWFIGYTPDIVIGVWVGYDDGTALKLTGAQAALPIWVDFFRKAIPITDRDFPVPPQIVTRMIDPQTSQLATSSCPQAQEEIFINGTEPTVFCEVHSPGFLDRLKHIFGM